MDLNLIRAGGAGGGSGVSSVSLIHPAAPLAGAELIIFSPGGTIKVIGMFLAFVANGATGLERVPSFILEDISTGLPIRTWNVTEGIIDGGAGGADQGTFTFGPSQGGLLPSGVIAERWFSPIGGIYYLDADFYLIAGQTRFLTNTFLMDPTDQWGLSGVLIQS